MVDVHNKKYTDIVDKYFSENQHQWRTYYLEVEKAILANRAIPETISKAAIGYCYSRISILSEAEQKLSDEKNKDKQLWELTVQNLQLQNKLTPLLIKDTTAQEQRVKDQNTIIKWGTAITALATLAGAIVGAKLTQNQEPPQTDTIVLPSIQTVYDTARPVDTIRDTVYVIDSVKK